MTTSTLLACTGSQVGQIRLPPFELHSGQFLCLHVPGPLHSHKEEAQLVAALTGNKPAPGLVVHGRIEHARQPTGNRWPWRLFVHSPLCSSWLRRAGQLPQPQADTIVAGLGLAPHWRILNVSGNLRTFLALEATWARRADAVIFTLCGWCDPRGWRWVQTGVTARLDTCAAIHLCFQDTNGHWCENLLPQARCISLERITDDAPLALAKS